MNICYEMCIHISYLMYVKINSFLNAFVHSHFAISLLRSVFRDSILLLTPCPKGDIGVLLQILNKSY